MLCKVLKFLIMFKQRKEWHENKSRFPCNSAVFFGIPHNVATFQQENAKPKVSDLFSLSLGSFCWDHSQIYVLNRNTNRKINTYSTKRVPFMIFHIYSIYSCSFPNSKITVLIYCIFGISKGLSYRFCRILIIKDILFDNKRQTFWVFRCL